MQLHISPSLRHVSVLPAKGVKEFIKVKIGNRRLSYRMVFYLLLILTFLLRFVFVLTAVDTIDGEIKCSTIVPSWTFWGPGAKTEKNAPEVIYQVLEEPPGLIAFHGHVHVINPFWHMLGLGYQDNTTIAEASSAGVIHFNGRAKPWLDIAFPQLRSLWTKYVDFSDRFIKSCHIRAS